MADVRGQAVDLPLPPIEREGEELALGKPEVFVETALQLGCLLLQARGQHLVAPDLPGKAGGAHLGVVYVALDLAGRPGRRRDLAVGEQDGVPGILPALVLQPRIGVALVLDVAVPVAIAAAIDPRQRGARVRLQIAHQLGIAGPPLVLVEQHEVQRRRVGCAEVRRLRPLAEPRELRFGQLTRFGERPQAPYFGAADTTPLYLVLLDEYERWTGDAKLVRDLEPNARAALAWIDRYGDRDGDGYVEYQRNTDAGLENQCWKDSWNSILFANGEVAPSPRATCEIQGYVYDAKMRSARLAREVWGDEVLAARLEQQAAELKRRFNEDFWLPEREFFALALDGRKRKVDSLTSNVGHLLWSGIVDEGKAEALARHLLGPKLFSGWGVRTMAEGEAGYNPIEYHNGTVWPHDSVFVAAGLARYGFREEASRIVEAILQASIFFRFRLPEVFAGYERSRTMFPVEYPTASSRSEEHTSELQSLAYLVCRLLLEKKKIK